MNYIDNYPNSSIDINRNAIPSSIGTYSAIVTGWTDPSKVSWELFPNALVRGHLYSVAGVERLIVNLSHNPHVDRVYLLKLSIYDNNSGSVDLASQRLAEIGFPHIVITDLSEVQKLDYGNRPKLEPLNSQTNMIPTDTSMDGLVVRGSDLSLMQAKIADYILKLGEYNPVRGFTALPCITSVLHPLPVPEYHPYFDQWTKPRLDNTVEYTYGDFLGSNLDTIAKMDNSTQRVIHLELNSDHPPCLAMVQRYRDRLIATFRSHDIGQAYKPNLEALCYLASKLDEINTLIVVSNVPHLYDWDRPNRATRFVPDPIGNFTVYHQDGKFFIEQDGAVIIQAKSRRGVVRKLARLYPQMDLEHSFYLFSQLAQVVLSP